MIARTIPLLMMWLVACDQNNGSKADPLVPVDFAGDYVKVRGCRSSPDHNLENVELWMDAASKDLWDRCVDAFPDGGSTCATPFPEGAMFVKPQYLDAGCTQLVRISVSQKSAVYAQSGGWHWQEIKIDGAKETVSQDGALTRCSRCHATCSGFDQRCYMDPD